MASLRCTPRLVQSRLFRSLDRHFPGRILNVTNGVTPRRWLLGCNPGLAGLLTDKLGDQWIGDLARIRDFEAHIEAEEVREAFRAAKHANKQRLADFVQDRLGVQLNRPRYSMCRSSGSTNISANSSISWRPSPTTWPSARAEPRLGTGG